MVHGKTVTSRLTECATMLARFPDFRIEFDPEKREWRVRCKAIYGAGLIWHDADMRGPDLRVTVAKLADAMSVEGAFVAFREDAEWKYARWLTRPECPCEGCANAHTGWEVAPQTEVLKDPTKWHGLKPEWVTDPDWHNRPERPWNGGQAPAHDRTPEVPTAGSNGHGTLH